MLHIRQIINVNSATHKTKDNLLASAETDQYSLFFIIGTQCTTDANLLVQAASIGWDMANERSRGHW